MLCHFGLRKCITDTLMMPQEVFSFDTWNHFGSSGFDFNRLGNDVIFLKNKTKEERRVSPLLQRVNSV